MYTTHKSIENVNEMCTVCLFLGVLVICTEVFVSVAADSPLFYNLSSLISLHLALFKNTIDRSIAFSLAQRMTIKVDTS